MTRLLTLQPRFLRSMLLSRMRTPLTHGSHWAAAAAFSTQAAVDSVSERPFDKVLIANRGEIVQRVIRTCKDLGISTVAVHSIADTKAEFVKAADETYCLGPAAASESYMNVPILLQAIQETGAQAVHPGYGFLSENAEFCRTINEKTGAVFLGPGPNAINLLGDKLLSKQVAEEAGVSIIPGHDSAVESLEQALHLCNNVIKYPVLVKAASGGGGKGMRVCYTDQEVKEAWPLAKAEAKKFFGDDRLLIEKFVERPHHIEFQVMCAKNPSTGEVDVVVFPERECSIQRRNQKVIEETPSCLLSQATREKMAEQVRQLCQKVGYESAGTVEWLVDEQENFFFLEMNTRLQVEHPVTEAVAGVDLVKAMLWVGAGWGLPDELKPYTKGVMPNNGHAIEARIYAEDPLRGFLPSTGPLVKYVEPPMQANTTESYVRVDSGVAEGHVVSPFYDPMLSKIIYHAPDRLQAIKGLSAALDEYVIGGVQHNARLVQAVLRHPSFVKGDTPTSFLPTHFPQGFKGVELSAAEEEEFAVAAALIGKVRRDIFQQPHLTGDSDAGEHVCVVNLGGMFGGKAYRVEVTDKNVKVQKLGEEGAAVRTLSLDDAVQYEPERYMARLSLDGTGRSVQVLGEDVTGEMSMQMYGAITNVLIQSQREYELTKYMHQPPVLDTSGLVLSPMPGNLISFAVKEGDEVQIGQELCVVEAMKMQNIIRSPQTGKISKIKVPVGANLKNDQVIMVFEKEE